MAGTVPIDPALPDPAEIQARAVRLATAVVGPFYSLYNRMGVVVVVTPGIAFAIALMAPDRLISIGGGLSVLFVGLGLTALPLRGRRFRAARELVADHNCHEAAEWKEETGTKMPRGLKAMERWLANHPVSPGRASLLLPLGRIAEADTAIAAIVPSTPEEAFAVDILRETRTLLLGGTPDLAPLRARWRDLPDLRERRHRRECLALLEAQAGVEHGADPINALAEARTEVDGVYWRYRTPVWLSLLIGLFGLLVVFAALLGASIAGL
jgi:hypothetical protein